jgi:predicted transglutaminase-like cysteine proteinase
MNILKGTAVCLALCAMTFPALGYTNKANTNLTSPGAIHAPVFGVTLPPIGYVQFCARYKAECRETSRGSSEAELNERTWSQIVEVNSFVNTKISPATDQEIYQTVERWEYPSTAGDCEDYVLLKKRYLEGLGFPAESLLITVVLDENGDGHAVLTVRTNGGDFILDNRRNTVLRWSETGYQFLKRQSQQNPRIWVSMSNQHPRNKDTIAGAN